MTMDRRNFIKGAVAMGGAAALAGLAGCAPKARGEELDGKPEGAASGSFANMQPGVYRATVPSIKGDMTVTTLVDEHVIQSVSMKAHDTKHILGAVAGSMIPAMVTNQSVEVDAVTGATHTSTALKEGVRACLDQAGATKDDFAADFTTKAVQTGIENWDVAVVGSGAAGLSSAIQLAKRGARVVVLERSGFFGGTTGFSSGGVWTSNTEFNDNVGYNFTPDSLVEHMYNACEVERGTLNEALIRKIAEVSGEVYDEYRFEAGAPWDVHAYTLGDSLKELPVSWAAMKWTTPYENNSGMTLVDSLVRHAQELGVDLRLDSQVTGLVLDEAGEVAGVSVMGRSKIYDINAAKVVLATGGFQRNRKLVEELAPQAAQLVPFTSAGSQGDAIIWGRELGAATTGEGVGGALGLNESFGYVGREGSTAFAANLRVNKEGEAFENILEQTDGAAFGIADGGNAAVEDIEHLVDMGLAVKADSLDALAKQIDIPVAALAASVDAYNQKAAEGGSSIGKAPFYAIPTCYVSYAVLAGLKADENCAILDTEGNAIPNLFGAGEVVLGNLCYNKYPGSGSSIGSGIYEGRIIADRIAEEMGL